MINANNKRIKAMLGITALLAIALGVFRTVILYNYVEPETGFYVVGTNVDLYFNIAVIALVLVMALFGLSVRKVKAPEFLDSHSTVVVFTSALCAFLYVTLFINGIYSLVASDGFSILFFLQVALCIPCCLNHLSICSKEVREKNTPQSLLAMSEAVFFAVRIVEVFMDTKHQINVSQRSLELVMLCSMMLFMLFEARFQIKSEEIDSGSIVKYYVSGLSTIAFTLLTVLPYLIVCLFWCFESRVIVVDVLECCIMLFAASRLLTLRDR